MMAKVLPTAFYRQLATVRSLTIALICAWQHAVWLSEKEQSLAGQDALHRTYLRRVRALAR
jgi:hypothetical protein